MYELNYSNVPNEFISSYSNNFIDFCTEITITHFLVEKLLKAENKTEFLKDLENEGFKILVNGQVYNIYKSFTWLKRHYYEYLKKSK
jgi:hypothetical protein